MDVITPSELHTLIAIAKLTVLVKLVERPDVAYETVPVNVVAVAKVLVTKLLSRYLFPTVPAWIKLVITVEVFVVSARIQLLDAVITVHVALVSVTTGTAALEDGK